MQTLHWDNVLGFDSEQGILDARPGVLLGDISQFSIPSGWMLPVTPGTELVTLGGAVANDVHGKNHLTDGSFGHHVIDFDLLRSDGELLHCSPENNAQWFYHTIGGLGLTGVLTRIRVQLKRVPGPWFTTRSLRMTSLTDYFTFEDEYASDWEHRVAWVDCLAKGNQTGRGWYLMANPAEHRQTLPARRQRSMPPVPFSPLNKLSLTLFNELIYRFSNRHNLEKLVDYKSFFYPLDHVSGWNKLYGSAGFQQYQCVIPPDSANDTIHELLGLIASAGQGSFLAVLKRFGNRPAAGALSFPREGYTLALDFPNKPKLQALFDAMDSCVRSASGAIYPAKDAHMSADFFQAAYPEWEQHEKMRDSAINSWFWKRVVTDT